MVCSIGKGLRTLSGETAAATVLAVTVFCVVLGSSSVAALVGPGKKLRWAALLLLAVVALVLALRERRGDVSRPLGVVIGLGAWLACLGLVSTAWSVDPRLTFGRAASFAVLMVVAGALALASRVRPALPGRLLVGMFAGTVAAAVVGVILVAFARNDALQPVSTLYPTRFRGLGENPDTMAMLEGLVVPVGLWIAVETRDRRMRLLALGSLLLLLGSISASGSRGGLVAVFVGGIAFSLAFRASWRRRLVLALSVCAAVAAATAGTQIPKPLASQPVPVKPGGPSAPVVPALPSVGEAVGSPETRYGGRLEDELFRVFSGTRSLFSSSGRLQTLYEAAKQGDARPALGFGFGTENVVFVDRVYNFQGEYVEDSVVGMYLQLGAIGATSLLALLAAVAAGAVLGVRRAAAGPAPAVAGVVAAGIVLMLVQSYAYSVGNVATVAFWTAGFVGAAVVAMPALRSAAVGRGARGRRRCFGVGASARVRACSFSTSTTGRASRPPPICCTTSAGSSSTSSTSRS